MIGVNDNVVNFSGESSELVQRDECRHANKMIRCILSNEHVRSVVAEASHELHHLSDGQFEIRFVPREFKEKLLDFCRMSEKYASIHFCRSIFDRIVHAIAFRLLNAKSISAEVLSLQLCVKKRFTSMIEPGYAISVNKIPIK